MTFSEILSRLSKKCGQFIVRAVQYGCVFHVILEHVGDFVIIFLGRLSQRLQNHIDIFIRSPLLTRTCGEPDVWRTVLAQMGGGWGDVREGFSRMWWECSGPSMEPTLFTNDAILSDHISPKLNKVRKGDIVIARSPNNPKQFICKRIAGVEGDRMCSGFISHIVVPRGHVWLEGDNRNNSSDSRSYGPVPLGLIRGRVLCVIWPPSHATLLTQA